MRTISLPSGEAIPVLGQGTWRMGEDARRRADEAAALRLGLDLGMTLIDTAEMYGSGGAEEMIAEAIAGRRDEVFLVSKLYPHNATAEGTPAACERSLKRLKTDVIDLYLLHWRGSVPLAETIGAFVTLVEQGKIRHFGVSNLEAEEMDEVRALPGGEACATDQVLYNLARREPERSLLPWCRAHGMPMMAYSPIDQGRMSRDRTLNEIAKRHDATWAQIALAWVLAQDGVFAIPKAARPDHVRQNRAALDLELTPEEMALLDKKFPAPHARLGMY
jgi:diketogulonate reductase-like aldo/keto reductase